MTTFLAILASVLAVSVAVVAVIYVVVPVFQGIRWIIVNTFKFIFREIGDTLRIVGSLFTTVVFVPLVLMSIVIGRWSAAGHYGSAIKREVANIGHCAYRVCIGNPARLLGLTGLVEGLERRVPEAMAQAPTSDKPSKRTGQFDGYKIIGSLRGGGSGAKIYVAEPDATKLAIFARAGRPDVDQVVIKSFSLRDGSSLPQIVRESRALEAAKKIGLVLEHDLNDQRFFYVMPYVPGEDLGVVTRRLHDASGAEGLDGRRLVEGCGYVADLVRTLDRYHRGGLWHKDVKPDNIIVSGGRAHVVDLGLVTPLASGMTLTTHGTEYFRDPEMVRLALKGVKVHEVDGAKFDIYAAGAVLYSVIENSFPAHGGLSQVTKRCPEAIRWIIRRAMTDYNTRYGSAHEMLADVQTVLAANDAYAVAPKDLPSMAGVDGDAGVAEAPRVAHAAAASENAPTEPVHPLAAMIAAGLDAAQWVKDAKRQAADAQGQQAPGAPPPPRGPMDPASGAAVGGRRRANVRVSDWWTGRYVAADAGQAGVPGPGPGAARSPRPNARAYAGPRPTAREQLASARRRVSAARQRATRRMNRSNRYNNNPNAGVGVAIAVAVAAVLATAAFQKIKSKPSTPRSEVTVHVGAEAAQNDDLAATVESAGQRFAEAIRRVQTAVASARTQAVERRSDGHASERTVSTGGSSAGTRMLVSDRAAPAVLDGSRPWLVLDDASARSDQNSRATVERRFARMKAAGYTVVGDGASDADISHTAGARAAIGVGVPTDPDTQRRLVAWLAGDGADLAGVVWVELSPSGEGPAYHLFATETGDVERLERLLDR